MKVFKTFVLFMIAGMFLTGCASVAHVEKDEAVNFSRYKSYEWIETTDSKQDSGKHVSDLTDRKIREAVNTELAKAGWREAKGRADVFISYDVLVEKAVRQDNDPVYSQPYRRMFYNPYSRRWSTIYYPSQFLGYESNQYSVREGTITITMVDAKTEKTIWQGWTTEEVNSKNLTSREIQNSVKSIFRKFDVAKR